eukprot:scaffold36825_cov62-Phaeocystis_antarctica.AAC.2
MKPSRSGPFWKLGSFSEAHPTTMHAGHVHARTACTVTSFPGGARGGSRTGLSSGASPAPRAGLRDAAVQAAYASPRSALAAPGQTSRSGSTGQKPRPGSTPHYAFADAGWPRENRPSALLVLGWPDYISPRNGELVV